MDITTAFLNVELDEEIYLMQPGGYAIKGKEGLVCKLNRSIKGLKGTNLSLNKYFTELGYTQSSSDPCLDTSSKEEQLGIAVYVDTTS
jgi:hypothetical protein